jgi:hypothetical protein
MRIPIRSTAVLLLAVTVASCGGDAPTQPRAEKLAFRSNPPGGVVNAALAPVQVELQDAGGNLTAAADSVTIALGANPNAATLGGTLTRNAVDGVATFDNLTIDKIGEYTLTASSASIAGVSPVVPITIGVGPAAQLVFLSQPTGALPGATLPSFVVQLRDQSGNAVDGSNPVTLSVATGTADAVLSGATVNAVNGIATFAVFSIDREGTYTLSATSPTLTSATSASYIISDVHAMALAQSPSASQTNGVVLSPQPTIQLNDGSASSNAVRKAGVVITATAAAAPGATNSIPNNVASFSRSGTFTATTDTNGLATFTNLGVLSTQGGLTGRVTFSVTSGTTQTIAAITSDVVVAAGTPTTVEKSSSVVLSTVVGTSLASANYPTVRLKDVGNSPVPNASAVAISFSVISGSCTTPSNAPVVLTTTAADGTASLSSSNLTVPIGAAGSCLVRATSSLTGAPIDFDIVVAASSGFTWLGAMSTDYTTSSNWRGGAAPTSGSNIYVPKSVPSSPDVAAATTVGALTLEAGASLNVSLDKLTVNGTTSAGSGSTFTVASGATTEFSGASTTLANLDVNGGTVQFDNAATITGAAVTTGTATIKHQTSAVLELTISGSLTTSSGTTLNGLRTVNFTGSTFPVYGNAATTGAPLVTKISADMTVPAGSPTVAGELVVSNANLTISGTTSLTVNAGFDVNGAMGELSMFGSPTLTVAGDAIFEGRGGTQGQGLSDGTLVLQGNFIQRDQTSGSHGEFEPGPNFTVKFAGNSAQAVSFDHPGSSVPTQSQFTNVIVANPAGVTQFTDVYIEGGAFSTMTIGVAGLGVWDVSSKNLFMGSTLRIALGAQLLIGSGGHLDLVGGTCTATDLASGLIIIPTGQVIDGNCTQGNVGSTDFLPRPWYGGPGRVSGR